MKIDADSPLTIIIPTHNRPRHCLAQLRFLRQCGVTHPITIADSSDRENAELISSGSATDAKYVFIDPSIEIVEKFACAAKTVTTPFIILIPDDDVTFPHAIDACLAYLQAHQDYAAADGYTLRFVLFNDYIDINGVFRFVPSIEAAAPLFRHYDLMRRYQPFMWAVFRTEIFVTAMTGAAAVRGITFHEFSFMSLAVLKGKIARLPNVFSMRGTEESHTAVTQSHPFIWFLNDPSSFFVRYHCYRNALAAFIRSDPALGKSLPPTTRLEDLLDLNHAVLFGREINMGMIHHQAQLLLGVPLPPIKLSPHEQGWREPAEDDVVHPSSRGDRSYIWRGSVLQAEPRDEIQIAPEEIALVERELDYYRLD